MRSILDRIQQIAINENITITALERSIGASKGVLSRAINNKTDIQAKWIQNIVENYPQYSADWLITGRGEMLLPSIQSAMELNKQEVLHQLLSKDDKTKFVYSSDFESSIVLKLIDLINDNQKSFEGITDTMHKLSRLNGQLIEEAASARNYYSKITEQAEEIGRLKERIAQLEREKGKVVSDVQTSDIANAG